MTDHEFNLYAKAGALAKYAMGKRNAGSNRYPHKVWVADEDPLACWCLIEAIVQIAKDYRTLTKTENRDGSKE